jgi:hypothetical protein
MLPLATGGHADKVPSLHELRELMRLPFAPREKIRNQARVAAKDLEPLIQSTASARYQVGPLLQNLLAPAPEGKDNFAQQLAQENWDGAAQVYLALAALYRAQADQAPERLDPQWKKHLAILRQQLEFPVKYDSPEEKAYGGREAKFLNALKTIKWQNQ